GASGLPPGPHGNPGRFCANSLGESSCRQTFLLKSGSLSSALHGHLSGWNEASICSNFCWFAAIVFAGPVSLTKRFPPDAVTIAPSRRYPGTVAAGAAIGPPIPEYSPAVSIVVIVRPWLVRLAICAGAIFPF